MKDQLGREIEYLRISVTQNCNLNCVYCSPGGLGNDFTTCDSSLTPHEFVTIVNAMVNLGISKVRITGGEPLTRPDLCQIIEGIAKIPGISDISMTTNGIKLDKMAQKLKNAGLMRVNISLDSLNREKFSFITGGGKLENVLHGIENAIRAGLSPVKINVVLVKGINDDEVEDFIYLAKNNPLEVRFIELMPIGRFGEDNAGKIVYNSDILSLHPELVPVENKASGPAKCYLGEGYKGRIGFISPMSHKFCHCCNRIRLTCDGKIKPCLGDNGEIDVTDVLFNHPERLEEFIEQIVFRKPAGHNFGDNFSSLRGMNAIGG